MPKADPLILTKLHLPPIRPGLVARPQLQARVMAGLQGPLTLVIAPAGFGKTTLVASSIADCDMPVAWVSLDKDDNQVGRFLNYLVAALQSANQQIGSEAAQLMAGMQPAPPEIVLTSIINDLDNISEDIALVLDDYQFISSQAVHAAMAFLLEHSPRSFHLLVATRSDPPLPLARLRARGQMVELRTADLSFTNSEAVQFFNEAMGFHLDEKSVEILEGRTEGWIAGLQMAALSIQGREDVDRFVREFAGTNRYILDFMLEEVLAREPEEVQAFLLQTAILKRLSGALCDAVTEASGSQEMLERLESRNLFVVPLDDERRWYRYHHLFADLLQERLYQSGVDKVDRLYARAAEWCERDGEVSEAVAYALAGRDYPLGEALIARHWGPLISDGEIETVWSWLNALPADSIKKSAPLSTAYCWLLWFTSQIEPIEAHLIDAERALDQLIIPEGSSATDETYAILPTMVATMRSIVTRHSKDYVAACKHAERALALIPKNISPNHNAQLQAMVHLALASAYDGAGDLQRAADAYAENIHWSRLGRSAVGVAGITYILIGFLRFLGRLRAADAACRDALGYIQAQGMARLPAAGVLHVAMSEVLVERNDLKAAQAQLSQGIELGKRSGRLDAVNNAAYVRSRLRLIQHDPAGALSAIQEAEAAMGEPAPPLAMAALFSYRARVLVRQGDVNEAARCVEEAIRLSDQEKGQTSAIVALAISRLQFAQFKPGETVAQLAQTLAVAEKQGWLGVAIELLILRSLALARQGNTQAAEVDLERAFTLAEPEGYVRIFIDEGEPMQKLIAQWLAHAGKNPLRDYASRLLAQYDSGLQAIMSPQEKAIPTGSLVEPISQREVEVLNLIALGKTNQEIARQLIVSIGTVKAHTANIYRKLDVANRTEAVARARQLGIIP
jgi:LuxR family maltose regulon positive regulatory protein